jgi:formiminoglutamase
LNPLADGASLPEPRADDWLHSGPEGAPFTFVGAPTSSLSLSPSEAHLTPPAFRKALARFATWDAEHGVDLSGTTCHDAGDVDMGGDGVQARERLEQALSGLFSPATTLGVCGGDNSITYACVRALAAGRGVELSSGRVGLLTLDAHHDLRAPHPRPSNGSPVRELVEGGLPGSRVVQVGIGAFANARSLTAFAETAGIRHHSAASVRLRGMAAVLQEALGQLDAEWVHVDFDIDVLDRAFAPGCPASVPGGLDPAQLGEAAFMAGRDARVASFDIAEVDAAADPQGTTLRAAVHVFLSFCAGAQSRESPA